MRWESSTWARRCADLRALKDCAAVGRGRPRCPFHADLSNRKGVTRAAHSKIGCAETADPVRVPRARHTAEAGLSNFSVGYRVALELLCGDRTVLDTSPADCQCRVGGATERD